jgi:predicted GTPase
LNDSFNLFYLEKNSNLKRTSNLSDITRSKLVVGKTGAGKSKLLNELIGKRIFKSSADTKSYTEKVMRSEYERVETKYNESDLLDAYDTPGFGDSQGRSKQFLNEIAETIRRTQLNMIIVLIEYGKLNTGCLQ